MRWPYATTNEGLNGPVASEPSVTSTENCSLAMSPASDEAMSSSEILATKLSVTAVLSGTGWLPTPPALESSGMKYQMSGLSALVMMRYSVALPPPSLTGASVTDTLI